jgi:hypothetical protein
MRLMAEKLWDPWWAMTGVRVVGKSGTLNLMR